MNRTTQRTVRSTKALAAYEAGNIWALACAVDRIQGGYIKEGKCSYDADGVVTSVTRPNKEILREMVKAGDFSIITDADRESGAAARAHFQGYMFQAISGKLNDFSRQALEIANTEAFTTRDALQLSILSCLPEIARRDAKRDEINNEIRFSNSIEAAVGATITGEIEVVACRYKADFDRFFIRARFNGTSFVDFYFGKELALGNKIKIRGKVKTHLANNVTRLTHVKDLTVN